MSEWISASEKLPEDGHDVLVFIPDIESYSIGSVEHREDGLTWRLGNDCIVWDFDFNLDLRFEDITYWQELPLPPKEENPNG